MHAAIKVIQAGACKACLQHPQTCLHTPSSSQHMHTLKLSYCTKVVNFPSVLSWMWMLYCHYVFHCLLSLVPSPWPLQTQPPSWLSWCAVLAWLPSTSSSLQMPSFLRKTMRTISSWHMRVWREASSKAEMLWIQGCQQWSGQAKSGQHCTSGASLLDPVQTSMFSRDRHMNDYNTSWGKGAFSQR